MERCLRSRKRCQGIRARVLQGCSPHNNCPPVDARLPAAFLSPQCLADPGETAEQCSLGPVELSHPLIKPVAGDGQP